MLITEYVRVEVGLICEILEMLAACLTLRSFCCRCCWYWYFAHFDRRLQRVLVSLWCQRVEAPQLVVYLCSWSRSSSYFNGFGPCSVAVAVLFVRPFHSFFINFGGIEVCVRVSSLPCRAAVAVAKVAECVGSHRDYALLIRENPRRLRSETTGTSDVPVLARLPSLDFIRIGE